MKLYFICLHMKQYEKKFQMLCFEVILSIENKVYYAWDNFVFIYLQGVQQDSHYALFATLYAISVSRRVQFFTSCSKLGVTFFPFFFCILCISLENCRCSCRPAFHIPSSTKHSHLTIDLFFLIQCEDNALCDLIAVVLKTSPV